MDPLTRFLAYAADFEKTFADDDWSRLEPYFAEDVAYAVEGMPAVECEVSGRSAVLAAIKRSLDHFDRRFDRRALEPDGPPSVEGNVVTIQGRLVYQKQGLPRLEMRAKEVAELEGDRIVRLRDVYEPGQTEALAWLERHGAGFDPRYVVEPA